MTCALLAPIHSFLHTPTPMAWLDEALRPKNMPILLIDHLVCELKAAQSGMYLIRRYAVDKASGDELLCWLKPFEDFIYQHVGYWHDLVAKNQLSKALLPKSHSPFGQLIIDKMVPLIKEELHHFYQVLEMMAALDIAYHSITSSRYAKGLLHHVTTHEPQALIDKLICGAYIEARSCERFAALAPLVDTRLGSFYQSLLRSEARHYQDYLALARLISTDDITPRIQFFGVREAELIHSYDPDFKFHSGIPAE
ncbi:tRNA isopentenyl-2-thiomethyl-A-37 hydroxylase MiaE [Celerinatantimonas yamalensis]|uniref:tRNA isopentenyl-2-thiomethyl-A-37 hydroxylase MiaE n=1 Tax=Celerinatantimonas yamalensis TaxID=559956 RepID=A0ABW9G7N1_9GAMM